MKQIPCLHNFLEDNANKYSLKTAVKTSSEEFTFSDIKKQSDAMSNFLKGNITRGDRVIVLLGNTIETVISFWGILKAGAIVIPIGLELKPDKIEYIIKDSGAEVLITNDLTASQNEEILKASGLKKIITTNKSDSLKGDLFQDYQEALSIGSKLPFEKTHLISIDLAAIIYTSGSTGEPKGVMLSHANMIAATNSLNAYLGYSDADKVLCALPLSFDYGLYQMIMSISTGATLVLEKEFTWPIFLLKKIVSEQISIVPAVPTMVMLLHDQNKKYNFDLSSVKSVTNTGAALTETNIDMVKSLFPNTKIFSMYGLTECKRCTYLPPEDIDKKVNSVGIAIPNTELWLIDDEGNKIKTPNTVGQLVIRGATVMQGYWKKPDKTQEKLKPGLYPNERVLHTGDYCSLDEDGYLYFKGRMDHMIKSRGIKVSPKEVEDFIGNIPQIEAVVVTGVPHKDYGEALFTFVVCKKDETISEQAIIEICKEKLEAYKVPEYVRVITSIPKTPNGKFNIIKLKETALEQVALQSTPELV